jgi:hypothetical protein
LLIVILFPELERVETRCGKPIIHLALACNGPTVAWQPQPRHRQFPFVCKKMPRPEGGGMKLPQSLAGARCSATSIA